MADIKTRAASPAGPAKPTGEKAAASADRLQDKSAFEFREKAGDESIGDLLRRLVDQGSHLAEEQAQLVQAEVRSSLNEIKQAAGAMAGAAVVGIAGLGVLLMGLSFLLGEVMALWLATLIVAAATLVGAYGLYESGKKKLQSSSFDIHRTRRTLERAPDAVSGHTKERRSNDR